MEKIVNKKINIFNENCYDNKSNRKFAKITFILCSLLCFMNIQSSIAQKLEPLKFPVICKNWENVDDGNSSFVKKVCDGYDELSDDQKRTLDFFGLSITTHDTISSTDFKDSATLAFNGTEISYLNNVNYLGGKIFCKVSKPAGTYSSGGKNRTYYNHTINKKSIYEHTLPQGKIMYSENSDKNHFTGGGNKKACTEWETIIDPMKLLSDLPIIGQAKIDPNFIEYE